MASHAAIPNSNLPLPPELRDKILIELLVRAEYCLNLKSPQDDWPWYETDMAYARRLSIISQVSKGMREEAYKIFFGQNEFSLTLRLERVISREQNAEQHPMRWNTVYGKVTTIDTTAFIKETWGEQALGLMERVHLYIRCRDLGIEDMVRDKLKDLVQIFRHGQNLKELSVNWQNYYTYPNISGKCGNPIIRELQKIRRSSRKEDGTRALPIRHENWLKEEMILEPLKELRGLEKVVVFGSVSDQWAIWLEQCMKSDKVNLLEFERIEDLPDVVKSGN
jgi:hypothetical protein